MTNISTLHYSVHNLASRAENQFTSLYSSADETNFDQNAMNWINQTSLCDVRQEVVDRILKIARFL